jgi:hypothetical protein
MSNATLSIPLKQRPYVSVFKAVSKTEWGNAFWKGELRLLPESFAESLSSGTYKYQITTEVQRVDGAGAVLPWKSDDKSTPQIEVDWTPAQKAKLLSDAGRSMYGRWWCGLRPGVDVVSLRSKNDQHANAGILPVIMFHPSYGPQDGEKMAMDGRDIVWLKKGVEIGRMSPESFGEMAAASLPANGIAALGNEIGSNFWTRITQADGSTKAQPFPYWPGDYQSAASFFGAASLEMSNRGVKNIASPCRSNPDIATAMSDTAILDATPHAYSLVNAHYYTDGTRGLLDRVKSTVGHYSAYAASRHMRTLVDEFGCLAQALTVKNFSDLGSIVVPSTDISCVWLLAPSSGQTAVALVDETGKRTEYGVEWLKMR